MSDPTPAPVSLVWATPGADALVAYMARVSAPENQANTATAPRLIGYLIKHKHWSPFEMVSLCMEIHTTRDIGRHVLRHSSLRPQEFSGRYADVRKLGPGIMRAARMQDPTNRQKSLPCTDDALAAWWLEAQQAHWDAAVRLYNEALDRGLAKEVARVVLPEGNTPTRMYFSGSMRSWLHFCQARRGNGTQPETQAIADAAWDVMRAECPIVCAAWEQAGE